MPLWGDSSQAMTVEGIFGPHPDISFPRDHSASGGTGFRTAEHWAELGPGSLQVRVGSRLGARASNFCCLRSYETSGSHTISYMDTTKT